MRFFGQKSNEETTVQKSDVLEWEQKVEAAAKAEGERISAEFPAMLQSAIDEHKRQSDGYSFACKRWGDFLTLYVSREANVEEPWYWTLRKKQSASLNLTKSNQIIMKPGHPADMSGELAFMLVQGRGGEASAHMKRSEDRDYYIRSMVPKIPLARPMIEDAPTPKENMMLASSSGETDIRYGHKPAPRISKDDMIIFRGIGTKIHVPFGKGDEVLAAILQEIANGYECRELPKGDKT